MWFWAEEPICHVVSGGEFCEQNFHPAPGDFVIAADSGYHHLRDLGHKPHLLLGDFDSLDAIPEGENLLRLPEEKDDTDTLYAVKVGLEKGFRRFLIHGALGGERFDHSIANIQTLLFLMEYDARGCLLGQDGTLMTAIRNEKLSLPGRKGEILSVFCMGDQAEGVSLSGVKYPMERATMTNGFPIGVSNQFTEEEARIEVENGSLLLIWKE